MLLIKNLLHTYSHNNAEMFIQQHNLWRMRFSVRLLCHCLAQITCYLHDIDFALCSTLLVIKKLSNINSWYKTGPKIWNNIINGLWKTKKMATWTLRLKDILWFRYEHPLKCKKSWIWSALVDNFWRPLILLL